MTTPATPENAPGPVLLPTPEVVQAQQLLARQQLAVIPQARLNEILSKLSADFEPGQLRHLLPRYWHPDEFFANPKHQNLWNRTDLINN